MISIIIGIGLIILFIVFLVFLVLAIEVIPNSGLSDGIAFTLALLFTFFGIGALMFGIDNILTRDGRIKQACKTKIIVTQKSIIEGKQYTVEKKFCKKWETYIMKDGSWLLIKEENK